MHALLLSWVCIFFFTLFSIVRVRGWLQLWIFFIALILMNMNWEVERLMRVFFVQNKLMSAKVRQNIDLGKIHQISLLENEKKLAETEKIQLRSLVI
jgi:hypothetical protein